MVNFHVVRPVQGVAHLNGDQHRKSHGHWGSSLKHLAVDPSKVLVVLAALHEVRLTGKMEKMVLIPVGWNWYLNPL